MDYTFFRQFEPMFENIGFQNRSSDDSKDNTLCKTLATKVTDFRITDSE